MPIIKLDDNRAVAQTNVGDSNIRKLLNQQRAGTASDAIAGPKTPEHMCYKYLCAALSNRAPQFIDRLWCWFADRPELFQWYDPGEYIVNDEGITMKLQIQKEKNARTGKYRYEDVQVSFTFAELAKMPEVNPSRIPVFA